MRPLVVQLRPGCRVSFCRNGRRKPDTSRRQPSMYLSLVACRFQIPFSQEELVDREIAGTNTAWREVPFSAFDSNHLVVEPFKLVECNRIRSPRCVKIVWRSSKRFVVAQNPSAKFIPDNLCI